MAFDAERVKLAVPISFTPEKGGPKAFCQAFNSFNHLSMQGQKVAWVQFAASWLDTKTKKRVHQLFSLRQHCTVGPMSHEDPTETAFIGVGTTGAAAYNFFAHPYMFKELGGPLTLDEKIKKKFNKFGIFDHLETLVLSPLQMHFGSFSNFCKSQNMTEMVGKFTTLNYFVNSEYRSGWFANGQPLVSNFSTLATFNHAEDYCNF